MLRALHARYCFTVGCRCRLSTCAQNSRSLTSGFMKVDGRHTHGKPFS